MRGFNSRIIIISTILLAVFCGTIDGQRTRERITRNPCDSNSGLTGVYRIDVAASDKLYSIIEGVSSNVPYREQQQFFMDLAIRLTPPDLLAIECRGTQVSVGSSRAPRVEFIADGATRSMRVAGGQTVRTRIGLEPNGFTFTSRGSRDDNLSFTFTLSDNGNRLRVTRSISAKELIEPVVIQTIYNKISPVARWDIYGESQEVGRNRSSSDAPAPLPKTTAFESENRKASDIRTALNEWIEATNSRDIEKQMSFYKPQLKTFYLSRNASRHSVRLEKNRIFAGAQTIEVQAAEPEIIFQDGGQMAIMRFRKKYKIQDKSKIRQGEVIQELRWEQTRSGWKIFSERDIRVLS